MWKYQKIEKNFQFFPVLGLLPALPKQMAVKLFEIWFFSQSIAPLWFLKLRKKSGTKNMKRYLADKCNESYD